MSSELNEHKTSPLVPEKTLLPIGSVDDIIRNAPSDISEEVLEVPQWGCSVRLRSFTAAQSAMVKQYGLTFRGEETVVAFAEMEIQQFVEGVVEPRFSKDEARHLYNISGAGFQRVINWLDEKSGTSKETLAKTRDEFPRSGEHAEN